MSDEQAYAAFKQVRFADNGGEAFCPKCGCTACYAFASRARFGCKSCSHRFTVTSGTIFASRKLALREYLLAIAIFTNGANGVSALRLSRDLNCSYKAAFVLLHKLRKVIEGLRAPEKLRGTVEIDGVHFGGHTKKANLKKDRKDRRRTHPKRMVVVAMRERRPGGRTLTFTYRHESEAVSAVLAHVDRRAHIRVDEAAHWMRLEAFYDNVKAVNHSEAYGLPGGVNTNYVESFNSRMRRGEKGVHHRIAGRYLGGYADEYAWREDFRRADNGRQFTILLGRSAATPQDQRWSGYWLKRRKQLAVQT